MNYVDFFTGLHQIMMENNIGSIRDEVNALREEDEQEATWE